MVESGGETKHWQWRSQDSSNGGAKEKDVCASA